MRIISGELRRRSLISPPDNVRTRPMPDRVREAVFNLLRGHVEGQAVVDVFAGTGSSGLEAISRGAASCLFVERDREIAGLLWENVEALGVEDRSEVAKVDALGVGAIARCPKPAHLVFFDPPYVMMRDEEQCARAMESFGRYVQILDDDGYAILRTPWPHARPVTDEENPEPLSEREFDLHVEGAVGPETHRYGTMALHLYMKSPGS